MFRLKYLPHRKKDERIIFFLRRHPYVLYRSLFIYLIIGVVPIFIYSYAKDYGMTLFNDGEFLVFVKLLIIVFYLFWWLFLYHNWLDYFLDVWIVTNHRVINIEQRGLFNRVVAEHKLFRIQDVMSEQKGILPTFFNYGEVHIQTAGTEKTVVFEQVPQPNEVAQETIKLVEWRKRRVAQRMEKIDKVDGVN